MTNNLSRRHHYIPQFLTKGFIDQNGLLFIYDKIKDEILRYRQPPKSIFYEYERNTIANNYEKDSYIEDVFYKKLDDSSAKVIKKFQYNIINDSLLTKDNIDELQFFIINLFWRLPITDYATKDLIERAEIKICGKSINDSIRKDSDFIKLNRSLLFKKTIEQFQIQNHKSEKFNIQVFGFSENLFLIGDYPIIYRNYLSQFTDLIQSEFKMAISSKRMICFSLNPMISFKQNMFLKYNATIIEQSTLYVASNDIRVLKSSIEYYKLLKDKGLHYEAKELLFRNQSS